MIARCPGCQTRYRLAPEKVGPQGARVRCSRCGNVFKVVLRAAAPAPARAPEPRRELKVRALVAESDAAVAKSIASVLERWSVGADVETDGGAALLRLARTRPALAILGARLPGLRAVAIAEIAKRMVDLQEVPLVRIAPADEPAAAPEFDADYALDPGDVPDGLEAALEELGVGERPEAAPPPAPPPSPASPSPQATPGPAPAPARARTPAPARAQGGEVAAAERLARIIVSDIILYNEDKFAAGIAAGDAAGELRTELEEAGELFRRRVPESLRAQRDFLAEEIERRAAARKS